MMSKELQEKADKIIEELKEYMIPLKEEIKNKKNPSKRYI